MSGMDGKGPQGTGPMGRRMGPCSLGLMGRGRGRGFRRGGGFGWNSAESSIAAENEKEVLENQKNWLEAQLASVNARIQGIEK